MNYCKGPLSAPVSSQPKSRWIGLDYSFGNLDFRHSNKSRGFVRRKFNGRSVHVYGSPQCWETGAYADEHPLI